MATSPMTTELQSRRRNKKESQHLQFQTPARCIKYPCPACHLHTERKSITPPWLLVVLSPPYHHPHYTSTNAHSENSRSIRANRKKKKKKKPNVCVFMRIQFNEHSALLYGALAIKVFQWQRQLLRLGKRWNTTLTRDSGLGCPPTYQDLAGTDGRCAGPFRVSKGR